MGSPREKTLPFSFSTYNGPATENTAAIRLARNHAVERREPAISSLKLLGSILNGLKEPVMVVFENLDLILNPAAERLLGIPVSPKEGEMQRFPATQVMPLWLRDKLPLEAARNGVAVEEHELILTSPADPQDVHYACSIQPLKEGNTGPALGGILMLWDISERKRNFELEQFALAASHDLSAPLRTVTTYLRLLEKNLEGDLTADSRQLMRFAVEGTQRMRELLDELFRSRAS